MWGRIGNGLRQWSVTKKSMTIVKILIKYDKRTWLDENLVKSWTFNQCNNNRSIKATKISPSCFSCCYIILNIFALFEVISLLALSDKQDN